MARSATARARSVPVRSRLYPVDLDAEREARRGEQRPKLGGRPVGSIIDWSEDGLFLDPETHALWDGGDVEARKTREMLRRDWRARQLELVLTQPTKGATWKLQPGDGDTGEAKDTEEKLRRPVAAGGMATSVDLVLAQATTCSAYRRAFFEKSFKLDGKANDQSIMYARLDMRPATTCRVRLDPKNGTFDGFEQDVQPYGLDRRSPGWDGQPVKVAAGRALVFVNGQDRDPIKGVSDLEIAYWCWQTKKKVVQLWLTFLAGAALPRTLTKSKGNEEAAKRVANMIAGMGASGVGYTDEDVDVNVLDTAGRGPAPYVEAIRYLDQCTSGSAVASFLDLASAAANGAGSFALSKDQSDFYLQTREAFNVQQASFMTSFVVAPLQRWNYGTRAAFSTFEYDELAGVDDQPIFTLLEALAAAQESQLPQAFINELAVLAAKSLNMDVDKLRPALEAQARRAEKIAEAKAKNPMQAQIARGVGAMNGAMGGVVRAARVKAGVR